MNGAVGTVHVHDPCYNKTRDGPYVHGDGEDNKNLEQYAIVGFPESDIPETDKFFPVPDLPRTCMQTHINANGGGETRKKVLQCSSAPTQVLQGPVHPQESGNDCWAWKQFKCLTVHYPTDNRQ